MTDTEKAGWWSRYQLTVEPVIMVIYITAAVAGAPTTDLAMRQGCRMYGMDLLECTQHDEIDVEVHRTTTNFILLSTVLNTLPGCLISLFSSTWSDTNGRKLPLLVALVGYALSQGIMTWMATLEDVHPYTYLLSGLPSMTGGLIVIIISSYCYLIDVTVTEDRSIRYAILAATTLISQIAGGIISPILANISYAAVYGFNTILLFLIILYSWCILPESIEVQQDKKTKFFTSKHVVESFHAFFMKRPNNGRGIVIAFTLATLFTVMMIVGEGEVRYQALMKVFDWHIEDYSQYNVITSSIIFLSTFGGVYVGNTLLGIDEIMLVLVFQVLGAIGSFLMAWPTTPLAYYLFTQFRNFLQCTAPLGKGIVSQNVEQSDIAKVIAFMNTLDSFTPQLGALLYSGFFNATVGTYPFAVHLLTCGLGLACCLCAIIAMLLRMKATRSRPECLETNERNEPNFGHVSAIDQE